MQSVEKIGKECYAEPLLKIVEWEGAGVICQSGGVSIDPGFDDETIIPLNQI